MLYIEKIRIDIIEFGESLEQALDLQDMTLLKNALYV